MDVGFVGLGHMGSAIAANLIRRGHQLRVWNRSPGPARELAALGANVLSHPADAVQGEVLMTMLADDAAVRAVLDDGLLAGARRGLVHINLATVSVALARELERDHRDNGIAYVAAPVFGRPDVAAAGKLNVVAAGDPRALERVRPLLEAIGQKVWLVGAEPERANVVKLAGNFMIASAIEAMGEAIALNHGYGVGARDFLDILTSTLFAAPAYQVYGRLIAEERYEPAAFKLSLGLKDVRLALEASEAAHVPMPFAGVLRDGFLDAIANDSAECDWAALARVAMRRAGFERST
jgi:3-hydroxyisobutyrate dehydrogenase-like beta-hydroxyacid dehydrogenase